MWQAGRVIKLAACLLGLASSLCWGEPAFVCFTDVEVKQIQQELETSGGQLIQSSQKSAELETLLQTLRLEYDELMKSYKRLSREKSLWKGTAAILAVTTVGMGLWIALSR